MVSELEPVPTVAEITSRSLARAVAWSVKGTPTHYQISAEGQRLIYEAQARNASKSKGSTDGN